MLFWGDGFVWFWFYKVIYSFLPSNAEFCGEPTLSWISDRYILTLLVCINAFFCDSKEQYKPVIMHIEMEAVNE